MWQGDKPRKIEQVVSTMFLGPIVVLNDAIIGLSEANVQVHGEPGSRYLSWHRLLPMSTLVISS